MRYIEDFTLEKIMTDTDLEYLFKKRNVYEQLVKIKKLLMITSTSKTALHSFLRILSVEDSVET
jgi:hypothetical protein